MILITSACSFGETHSGECQTWPAHLNKILQPSLWTNCSMGSQGNGLISKKVIYQISQHNDYDDILVGIMWSGVDRHEFYTTCLLYTSPSPRDRQKSRMPSSA